MNAQERQYERIMAYSNGNLLANCEECGAAIPVELSRCADCEATLDVAAEEWADNSGSCCPDCERPNQFGELCASCQREGALVSNSDADYRDRD